MLDGLRFVLDSFYMKTIKMLLMSVLVSGAMAEDEGEMEAFVGGVYGKSGYAVVLDKDTALVNGQLVIRNGYVFTTPQGNYSNNNGVYSGPEGIVTRNGDVFAGSNGVRFDSGDAYFGEGGTTIVTRVSATMRKP